MYPISGYYIYISATYTPPLFTHHHNYPPLPVPNLPTFPFPVLWIVSMFVDVMGEGEWMDG